MPSDLRGIIQRAIIKLILEKGVTLYSIVEKSLPYSSQAIANEILTQAKDKGISITHLQLQKLVYLAHALHVVIKKEPLISENIKAWKYGPVISSLYDSCSLFGSSAINSPVTRYDLSDDNDLMTVTPRVKENSTINNLISAVINKYGELTAGQLISLTHEADSAWGVTEKYHKSGDVSDYVIPIEIIGEVEGKHLLSDDYLKKVQ